LIFTARCYAESTVMLQYVISLSVRQSFCDVQVLWSHTLETWITSKIISWLNSIRYLSTWI